MLSLSHVAAAIATPLWRGTHILFRVVVGLLFAVWSLLLLAWLTLHWGILPRIDDWRPRVEALASRSLGQPVTIGHIEVRTGSWVPAAELREVVLHDAQGRQALRLPRVTASLSMPALLAFELRFDQLLIDNAQLEIRRDAQGHVHVAGIDVEGADAGAGSSALADWFFQQHEFVIRRGTLRWVDERRAAPPLALTDVQLVVRNSLRRHDLRLDATPPADWGERFTLMARMRQPLLARAGDWMRWSGALHASLPAADVGELGRYVELPVALSRGAGALRAWVDVTQGRPQAATVDVALRDVDLRLGRDLEPLAVRELTSRLVAERRGDRVKLAAEGLRFVTAADTPRNDHRELSWPASRVALALTQPEPAPGQAWDAPPVTAGELQADRLDLAVMAAIAERLPLGAPLRKLLTELAPEGQVNDLTLGWQGPLDAPTQYQAKARMTGVSIASAPSPEPDGIGRPGWRNADLELTASDVGGQAHLWLNQGALDFPGVFEEPVVALQRFDAQLQWRITKAKAAGQPPAIELKVRDAKFENEDAQGELNATWRTGAGTAAAGTFGRGARLPGALDLSGKLMRGRATAVARYLPLRLPADTRHYVRDAVREGTVTKADFKVRGDLWDFPFYNARDGEFRIAGHVQDVTLAVVPDIAASGATPSWTSPWPAFSSVAGELVFDRTSMAIRNAQGKLWGVALSQVNGGIRNVVDKATLELDGRASGPLSDLLRFVNTTPVGEWTQRALAGASASGPAELALGLKLPLDKLAQSTVKGTVTLAGNELRLRPDVPVLTAARGRIEFSQRGFALNGTTAKALGGDVAIDGGQQGDTPLRLNASGTATAEGLRRAGDAPALAPLAQAGALMQGSAPYRVQVVLNRGTPELTITSPLTGMAIDLPAPLGKAAAATLPLKVQTSVLPDTTPGGRGTARDQVRIDWGNVAQAQWQREWPREGSADDARVLRGALALGTALPPLAMPVAAAIEVDHLDIDAWQATLKRWGAVATHGASPAATAVADTAAAAPSWLPGQIRLQARSLLAGGRRLQGLKADLQRANLDGGEGWRARVDADQVAGLVEYREARSGVGAGRLYARLQRLTLPPSEAEGVESLLDTTSVPALDVVIDDLELRGRKLGRLEVQAVNRGVAAGDAPREWRLTELKLKTPEATLTGTGQWAAATTPGAGAGALARRRMVLDFRLDLADSGALLERLGFGRVMKGGRGQIGGQLQWAGSPLSLDLPSLEGQIGLSLAQGQMLQADNPGSARLLGVLSLQALPRRLLLDFRDVFQEGFSFDAVSGDVGIARGVASTRNLRLRGVQATVLMEGRADIARETQDLRVYVVPEINAGAASLAYAAINPAIGLGTFVAQWLLRRPLIAANTREFHVTGAWDAPQVERVERQPGATVPDTEPPPAAGTAAAAASMPARAP